MNEKEIESLQTMLQEINSFFPYEKNSYHYLHNHLFYTSYPYDKKFTPSPWHRSLYKELIQQKRFYSIKEPVPFLKQEALWEPDQSA
jgi:hypothetical protein